jgi:gliding motility-associated-like protein
MRRLSSLLFIVPFLLNCLYCSGQGWSWARGNLGVGMDGWPVATDPAGNVFCSGITFGAQPAIFNGYAVPVNGTPSMQAILAKYDGDGNFLWARGTGKGNAWVTNIVTDINGNALMFGAILSDKLEIGGITLNNVLLPKIMYFIAKFDPSGNVLWAVADGQVDAYVGSAGGISTVLGLGGVTTDFLGNIYVTCGFNNPTISVGSFTITNTDPTGATSDILLAKYSPTGSVLWAKSAGGTKDDHSFGITTTPAGDVYVSGEYKSPSVTFGTSVIANTGSAYGLGFIARYNSTGAPQWATGSILSSTSDKISAIGLAADLNNNVYLTGGFSGNDLSYGSGITITNPNPLYSSLYLIKFDPSNNVSWHKTISTIYNSSGSSAKHGTWGYCIATSFCGLVWVSGVMNIGDTINVDGQLLPNPPNSQDPIFIAGYNTTTGSLYRAEGLQSGGDDQNGIACDASGNLFVCSDYWSGLPFTVAKDTLDTVSGAGELLYVAKYNSDSTQKIEHSNTRDCFQQNVHITAPDGYTTYLWNDGATEKIHFAADTGLYYVLSIRECADISYDTITLSDKCDCTNSIFVPNSFTPNNDGHNDVFYPRVQGGVGEIKSFRVYDRWGEMLFERKNLTPNDISNAWDGTYKGQPPRPEVFMYVIEASCTNGNDITKKGSVTVIK